MNSTVKAYLAGLLDGEGTVTLARQHKNETHAPEVSIANCNLALLQWVKEKVGAGFIVRKRYKKSSNHSDAYAWTIRNNGAIDFLRSLFPFLIVKKERARLIMERYKAVTKRNGRYTADDLRRKGDLVAEIRRLNQRGIYTSYNTLDSLLIETGKG